MDVATDSNSGEEGRPRKENHGHLVDISEELPCQTPRHKFEYLLPWAEQSACLRKKEKRKRKLTAHEKCMWFEDGARLASRRQTTMQRKLKMKENRDHHEKRYSSTLLEISRRFMVAVLTGWMIRHVQYISTAARSPQRRQRLQ